MVLDPESLPAASKLRNEYVIHVQGAPRKRTEEGINRKMATGTVEVNATSVQILNTVNASLPFTVSASESSGLF